MRNEKRINLEEERCFVLRAPVQMIVYPSFINTTSHTELWNIRKGKGKRGREGRPFFSEKNVEQSKHCLTLWKARNDDKCSVNLASASTAKARERWMNAFNVLRLECSAHSAPFIVQNALWKGFKLLPFVPRNRIPLHHVLNIPFFPLILTHVDSIQLIKQESSRVNCRANARSVHRIKSSPLLFSVFDSSTIRFIILTDYPRRENFTNFCLCSRPGRPGSARSPSPRRIACTASWWNRRPTGSSRFPGWWRNRRAQGPRSCESPRCPQPWPSISRSRTLPKRRSCRCTSLERWTSRTSAPAIFHASTSCSKGTRSSGSDGVPRGREAVACTCTRSAARTCPNPRSSRPSLN